ncbi:tRNA (adenosine(37)-N6)-threonylcarbamoyltransferase complex dimerization subunit type 1 TsaB [Parasporobacterium paucivorans]|uniref:tRNA threonylcarbamoyladenosine biosynthesis protein TsaB n=1 Tax=Parasporobacterium paucivorans DSM 15970 TaxID=1122934 RepID=A0A1M6KNT2_9FIRM|nr:tRNA (adenosine(37)-N6)-threonylcarbamoyltransferase complex dimerization subunit type 1 TsaB [Parasporobacterium paucivorans]SHJ60585.1 tRNA threonylcarbamoyladenosine biosynthesis protein TsaB [Parasporobacterium paucivorans DSM 15970]
MKILAIDSSSLVASVAVAEDDVLIAEYTVNFKKTHSQTLLPMIEEITSMIQLKLETIDAIAVSGGPGSFTGLRIGSATAKGLGLALDRPLIHVPTLAALAYNLYGTEKLICPIMDARRQQVYTGIYTFEKGVFTTVRDQEALLVSELADILNEIGREVIFLGDGVPAYKEELDALVTTGHSYAPLNVNRQRAASVAALGKLYYERGETVSSDEHIPEYIRISQAERGLRDSKENDNR